MRTPVLAAGRLTSVLSLDGHAARRDGAVLINAHRDIFLFIDRFQRGCAGFNVREPLRFRRYVSGCIHKHVIISPDFFQRRNIALQQGCLVVFDRLSDFLFTFLSVDSCWASPNANDRNVTVTAMYWVVHFMVKLLCSFLTDLKQVAQV